MFGIASSCAKRALTTTSTILLFLVAACDSQQSGKASSECYYETVETIAEVIDMKPHPDGDGRIAVIMDFKASVLALEDQELGKLRDAKIDHDYLERNGIEMGNKYEVTVSELTRGDCDTKLTVAFHHSFE